MLPCGSQVTLEFEIKIGLSKLPAMAKEIAHPDIGRRIETLRKERGLTLRELAAPFGKTPQTAANWKDGRNLPSPPEYLQLAEMLGVNVVWLTSGKGAREPEALRDAVVIQKPRGRLVPRLALKDVEDKRTSITSQDHAKVLTHFECGPKSFEFLIEDASNAPDFTIGDSIIIDPDQSHVPGDMVLALVGTQAVFRKLVSKGGNKVELRPLNGDWSPEIVELGRDAEIVGTMSEHARPRRR